MMSGFSLSRVARALHWRGRFEALGGVRALGERTLGAWVGGLSTFEKVILTNSVVICLDTVAGWWITQQRPETYHYLIDTSFIALAAVVCLLVNFAILRAAFAPLHATLATIQAIELGDVEARAVVPAYDADAQTLARALNAMLDQLGRLRDEATARTLRAQEEERRQVALELHDQTGQNLTALALRAEAVAQQLGQVSDVVALRARAQVEQLGRLAQQTLAEVQALSRQLRPPLLDDLGLVAALRWLAADGGARLGVEARVRARGVGVAEGQEEGQEERLTPEMEVALFRVAQECLTNAARHGRAQQVGLALIRRRTEVTLLVVDSGEGFVVGESGGYGGEAPATRYALGLEGMRERVRMLGGRLTIRSAPGAGCAVRVSAPAPARSAGAGGEEGRGEEGRGEEGRGEEGALRGAGARVGR